MFIKIVIIINLYDGSRQHFNTLDIFLQKFNTYRIYLQRSCFFLYYQEVNKNLQTDLIKGTAHGLCI